MSTPPQHDINRLGLPGLRLSQWLGGFQIAGFTNEQVVWVFQHVQLNMEVAYGILWEHMPDWKFTQDLVARHQLQVQWKRHNASGRAVEIEMFKQGVRVAHLVSN